MNKFSSFFLACLMACTVTAAEQEIDLTQFGTGWGEVTVNGGDMNFTDVSDWNAGAQYWLESADWSAYDSLVIELQQAADVQVVLKAEYNAGGETEVTLEPGMTRAAAALASAKNDVQKIYVLVPSTAHIYIARIILNTRVGGGSEDDPSQETLPALTFGTPNAGWEYSFDAATHAITFQGEWKACGWNLGGMDVSAYDELYLQFESITAGTYVYIDGAEMGNAQEGTEIIIPIDGISSVNELLIKTNSACTLVLIDAYFRQRDPSAPIPARGLNFSDLSDWGGVQFNGGQCTFSTGGNDQGAQWWFNDLQDWSSYDSLVVELSEVLAVELDFTIAYENAEESDWTRQSLAAGGVRMAIPLDAAHKDAVRKVYFRVSDAAVVSLSRVYLVARTPDVTTAVGDLSSEQIQRVGADVFTAAQPICVYTADGRMVARGTRIDMSGRASGVYVLRCGNETVKVMH